jgi:hypothetical protein
VAVSNIGDDVVVHGQEREIIRNPWKFMSDESVDDIQIPLKSAGYQWHFQANICKDFQTGKGIDTGMSSFSIAGNHARENKMVSVVDEFDHEVIGRLIYNFHAREKQRPALNTIFP